jgi:hypothetical protein
MSTSIGLICEKVRTAYREDKLTGEQVSTLTEAKFDVDPFESRWTKFHVAWSVARQSGKVRSGQICEDTRLQIGNWQNAQRKCHRNGKMPESRVLKMDEVDPEWYNGRF